MAYELPPLPYSFDALEPHIDAKTMEIHHDKHHQAYITNANKALKDYPELAAKPVEESDRRSERRAGGDPDRCPQQRRRPREPLVVLDDPRPKGRAERPTASWRTRSTPTFGSFDQFKEKFQAAGATASAAAGPGWWSTKRQTGNRFDRQPGQSDHATA